MRQSQKNRPDLAWFARRATAWILDKARERRTVRGQRRDERVDAATRAVRHLPRVARPGVLARHLSPRARH
jgi:hypothetical protein